MLCQISTEQYLAGGIHDLNNGYLITALEKFNKAIEKDSTYAKAYYYRAKTYIKGAYADYYPPAINDCEKCITLAPDSNFWEAYYYLAKLNYARDSAYINYFDRALQFNPNNVEIILYRAFAKNWHNKTKEALEDYNLAIKLEPRNIDALISRGIFYINKDNKLALRDLFKAKKIDKKNADIFYEIGNTYYWMSKVGKKCNYCKYYKKAVNLGYKGYIIMMKDCGIDYKKE